MYNSNVCVCMLHYSIDSNLPVNAIPVLKLVERSRAYAFMQQQRRIPGIKYKICKNPIRNLAFM